MSRFKTTVPSQSHNFILTQSLNKPVADRCGAEVVEFSMLLNPCQSKYLVEIPIEIIDYFQS